jgi:glutathione S-transferase
VLKIYGVPISVHTRKVIVAALVKGLAFEVVPVVPVIAEQLPPNWRTLSPTGKIPALTHDDFALGDSAAICAYFEHLRPDPPLYPRPAREHARVLSLEQYAGTVFRDVVHPLFHETVVNPKMRQAPTNQSRVDEVMTQAVPETFGYLEGIAGEGFLVGQALSTADIAVASNLIMFQYLGFDLQSGRFPRLAALFGRILRQPAMREALSREKPVVASMGLRDDFLAPVFA